MRRNRSSRNKYNHKIVTRQRVRSRGAITLDMDCSCSYLFDLCYDGKLDAVRKYLASNANANANEKKQQICYRAEEKHNFTCLHWTCRNGAPDDIVKTLINMGGKKLVLMKSSGWYG